jgi:hypothetical protein
VTTRLMFAGVAVAASAAFAQPEVRKDDTGARALAVVANAGNPTGITKVKSPATDGQSWSALGPFGGDVQDVASSPTVPATMLAGLAPSGSVGGSMYRSTDSGASWAIVPALSTTSVYDIEFAPDGTAYAGTISGVWKSTDAGASWTQLTLGIGINQQVFDVAIDPTNAQNLWAGVADALGSQTQNVIRSINGGATWTNATPPLGAAMSAHAIAINPANTQVIGVAFAGAFGGGQVWVSSDGGGTWQDRSSGLPNTPAKTMVHDGTRFLVGGGQLFGSQNFGLFSSPDLGATWTSLHGTWPTQVATKIALDPNNVQNILVSTVVGVFRSTNGGASWSFGVGNTSSFSVNAVRFAPGSSTRAFLGANSVGIYQTADGGNTFTASSVGIGALNVFSVAANPLNTDDMAIAFQGQNNGGVYRSTDGGQSWQIQSCPGTRYNTVKYTPDGTLYAISDGPTGIAPEGLYRRNPDGTWTGIGPDQGTFFESELFAMEFSTTNPDLIIAGGSDFGVAGFKTTVWRSTNAGANWTKVYLGPDDFKPVVDLAIAADGTDQNILGSMIDNSGNRAGGVLRSTDGGGTFATSNTGLPSIFQGSSLAPSPAASNIFFLSNGDQSFPGPTGGGLFKSTDGGASWTATGYAQVAKFVDSDPTDAQVLYITQPGSGGVQDRVLRSGDGGVTFQLFSDGLPAQSGFSQWLAAIGGPTPKLLLATTTGTYGLELGASCYANCDGSTTAPILNVQDFACFLNAFANGEPYANCDGSTTPPVFNVQDFSCFLNAFAAGCP